MLVSGLGCDKRTCCASARSAKMASDDSVFAIPTGRVMCMEKDYCGMKRVNGCFLRENDENRCPAAGSFVSAADSFVGFDCRSGFCYAHHVRVQHDKTFIARLT